MIFNRIINQFKNNVLSTNDNAILHNRLVLYFILFIALGDLFLLSIKKDFVSIVVFILVGFLTSFFSKNMTIILFIALTITNILKYGSDIQSENFEPADETDDEPEKNKNKNDEVLISNKKKELKKKSKNVKNSKKDLDEPFDDMEDDNEVVENKLNKSKLSTKEVARKLKNIVSIMNS